MKLIAGVVVAEYENDFVAVTTGEAGKAFQGMINLNGVAAFIVKQLQNDRTEDEIVDAICGEYDVDRERAAADVRNAVEKFDEVGLLER